MQQSDAHAFWRDPASDKRVSAKYKSTCVPEFFPSLKAVSDMWVGIFEKYVPKDATILELGCNCGRNLHWLRKAGYRWATGVEINPRAREVAEREFGAETAALIATSSIEDYVDPDKWFGVVFTSGVLMHLHPESEWVFQIMADMARGWLMCSEVEAQADTKKNFYEWPRNYRTIFEGLGFEQVHEQLATAQSGRTILRVFKRR